MKIRKRRFSHDEKFAVWKCNGSRCWYCTEPLPLWETTIDHVLPEWLLYNDAARTSTLLDYGLPQDFGINSYANWLPCHDRCNREKGARPLKFVPGHRVILERLIEQAPRAEKLARSVRLDVEKDKVFSKVFSALERRKISIIDIRELLDSFVERPKQAGVPDDEIILDSGYWFRHDEFEGRACADAIEIHASAMITRSIVIFRRTSLLGLLKRGFFGGAMTRLLIVRGVLRNTREAMWVEMDFANDRTSISRISMIDGLADFKLIPDHVSAADQLSAEIAPAVAPGTPGLAR